MASSLKEWFVSNGCFDKNLLVVFPRYGINNPDEDLKNLSPSQWKEIKTNILRERAAELKSAAAKQRLNQKLTKVEKLWKASRAPPKKKKGKKKSMTPVKRKSTKKKANNLTGIDETNVILPSIAVTPKSPKTPTKPKSPKVSMQEMEDLRKKHKELDKERNELMIEFNLHKKNHQTKIDSLQHEKQTLNTEWENKYNTKEIEFREIQKVYNKYKQLNYDHNNKKITIEAQIKEATETNETLTQSNQELEAQLSANKTETEEIRKKYTELQVKYTLIDNEKTKFDSKQNELRDDMQQVKDYNKLLKSNLDELEQKNKEMKELAATCKEEQMESENKLSLKNKELNHLSSKYSQVLDEYQQLQEENVNRENIIKELQEKAKPKANASNEEDQINALTQENESLKDRIDQMLAIEQDLNELIRKKTNRIKKLEKENRELQNKDLKELDSNINHQNDLLKLQKENDDVQHSYNKLKRKYDILYESTQTNSEEMNGLIAENKKLKSKLKSSKRKAALDGVLKGLETPQAEIDAITSERDELKNLCNEMRMYIQDNELSYKGSHSRSKSKSKPKKSKSKPITKKKHKKKDDNKSTKLDIDPDTFLSAFD